MTMAPLAWLAAALISLAGPVRAATAQDWAQRSIYQVMTDRFALPNGSRTDNCNLSSYCGGSWKAIIENLDYIQNMGFTALQISPVDKNMPQSTLSGEAYHGYWPSDKYSVNENFGTVADLKNLSDSLHARDMYLLVDVVINDMAYAIPNNGMIYPNTVANVSQLNPFNKPEYYHPPCNITDYSNPINYQGCWFSTQYVALPDLDTESSAVISMTQDWIKSLVANYSIDGLRIDAAKHVDNAFLPYFVEAAGVYTFGEVDSATSEQVCFYNNVTGLESYAVYYAMIQAFTAGNMTGLSATIQGTAKDCTYAPGLQNFAENQDQERFASYTDDMALASNALTFSMMHDGVPKVYYGQEQHYKGQGTPDNRAPLWPTGFDTSGPLYNLTTTLNLLRNHAINLDSRWYQQPSVELYLDNATMVMKKGPPNAQTITVYSNQGSTSGAYPLDVGDAFPPGAQVTDVLTCKTQYADAVTGHITVPMNAGAPHVYFPTYNMPGSGLCGTNLDKGAINNGTVGTGSGSGSKSHGGQISARLSTVAVGVLVTMSYWLL